MSEPTSEVAPPDVTSTREVTTPILAQIAAKSAEAPGALAFAFPGLDGDALEIGWGELDATVRRLSGFLRLRGIAAGDVVLILTRTVPRQILAFLAALGCGALPSILSFPSVKQSDAAFAKTFGPIVARTAAKWVVCDDEFRAIATASGRTLVPISFPEAAELEGTPPSLVARASPDLFLQFSSGTTGLRKAVVVRESMLVDQASAYGRALGISSEDLVASWLPLYHDMGLVGAFLVPLLHGVPSVHLSPFDWLQRPALLFEAISRYGATLVFQPNFAYGLLASRVPEPSPGTSLSSLRAMINCSEPVRPEAHELFFERFGALGITPDRLQACYAMAENTFAVTQTALGRPARVHAVSRKAFVSEHRCVPANPSDHANEVLRFVSCGSPIENTQVRIAGGKPEGEVGEIEIRGDCILEGYYSAEGLDRSAFTEDGWYRSGDLGYLDKNELFVTGRAKDLIIHRGANVYPNDVEECIAAVEGCKPGRVVVFGVYDEVAGTESVVALCEKEEGVDDVDLARRVRAEVLGRHGIALSEVVVHVPGTLRKSTSGKLSRNGNRELYLEGLAARKASDEGAARTELRDLWEGRLTFVWREALGREVGIRDHLFLDHAADSVATMRVVAAIEGFSGRRVDAASLLSLPTIEMQARMLRSLEDASPDFLVTLRAEGRGAPFFLVHPASGHVFRYLALARSLDRPVFAFQSPELREGKTLAFDEMIDRYLRRLMEAQPRGPYLLGGWSFGGLVAFEMARRLTARGERIGALVLFDTRAPARRLEGWAKRRIAKALEWAVLRDARFGRALGRLPIFRSPLRRGIVGLRESNTPRELLLMMDFALPGRFDVDELKARGLSREELWTLLWEELKEAVSPEERDRLVLPDSEPSYVRHAALVWKHHLLLELSYRPPAPFAGGLELFVTTENRSAGRWSEWISGPIGVRPYPIRATRFLDAHRAMMDESNVALFAGDLERFLAGAAEA